MSTQEEMYLPCLNFIVVICYAVFITERIVIDKSPYLAVCTIGSYKVSAISLAFQNIFNNTYCLVTTVLQVLLISNKKNCRCFIEVRYVKRNGEI
jgi:hypothetical protein